MLIHSRALSVEPCALFKAETDSLGLNNSVLDQDFITSEFIEYKVGTKQKELCRGFARRWQ